MVSRFEVLTHRSCDDGNKRAGDGCSSACALEPGFTCAADDAPPPDTALLPLTVREVAARLRVCAATVYGLIARNELAHVRVSNAIRVRASDVEAFIGRSFT